MRPTTVLSVCVLALTVGALGGCGSDGTPTAQTDVPASADFGPGADTAGAAADQTVCAADATAIEPPYGDGFPPGWTFPSATVVYGSENRAGTGVIVTAVSRAPFDDILSYLNQDEVAAGFTITHGETEEDDAEADWTSSGYSGRWTIRKSATCAGETTIQVFAAT